MDMWKGYKYAIGDVLKGYFGENAVGFGMGNLCSYMAWLLSHVWVPGQDWILSLVMKVKLRGGVPLFDTCGITDDVHAHPPFSATPELPGMKLGEL
ncbi:hypothetical protein VNO78_08051 [Psophocarpus tetragonolobus]|uniref:Uncharacterized protein n=1 Tax=Psophocarpus tetragonolobus TaxID=3891 RepID=A0AAN9SVR0_PSOTE